MGVPFVARAVKGVVDVRGSRRARAAMSAGPGRGGLHVARDRRVGRESRVGKVFQMMDDHLLRWYRARCDKCCDMVKACREMSTYPRSKHTQRGGMT